MGTNLTGSTLDDADEATDSYSNCTTLYEHEVDTTPVQQNLTLQNCNRTTRNCLVDVDYV